MRSQFEKFTLHNFGCESTPNVPVTTSMEGASWAPDVQMVTRPIRRFGCSTDIFDAGSNVRMKTYIYIYIYMVSRAKMLNW